MKQSSPAPVLLGFALPRAGAAGFLKRALPMPRVVGNQSAARRVEACAHARLHLAMCHAKSDPNENRPASALLCRYREPGVGKLGNHLRDGPRLREAGRFCAGQGAGSCRRDDSDARTQSKSLLCEEGLTSGKRSSRLGGFTPGLGLVVLRPKLDSIRNCTSLSGGGGGLTAGVELFPFIEKRQALELWEQRLANLAVWLIVAVTRGYSYGA